MNHGTFPTLHESFLIRPNRSLTSRQSAMLVAGVGGFSLVIAGGLSLIFGAWPILPFAGLEIGLLVFAVWFVDRGASRREIIELGDDEVVVSSIKAGRVESVRFQRYWCQVELVSSTKRNHPNRLLIGSHGNRIQVGSCLTDEERSDLADQLGKNLHLRRVGR